MYWAKAWRSQVRLLFQTAQIPLPVSFFIDPSLIMYLTLFYASHRPDITDNYCTSTLSRISFTSFSSSFESLPPVNLSTMSGTISRIFVIVSWFLIFTSLGVSILDHKNCARCHLAANTSGSFFLLVRIKRSGSNCKRYIHQWKK